MKTTWQRSLWCVPTLLICTFHACAEVIWSGYAELSASAGNVPNAWIDAGSGVVGTGDGVSAEARLGVQFRGESRFSAQLSGLARVGADQELGRHAGLLEAFVDYGDLSIDAFRLRSGLYFSGTSLENTEAFWQSPYTLSLSALNSWIGEEFRPLGVDFSRRFAGADQSGWDLSASVFGGNDTSAALLAWRGFAVHNRLSVFGETLPVLALPSLSDPAGFFAQRRDGSQAFGPDLDGRPGFLLRARRNDARGGSFRLSFTDNRGDRFLYGDEYSWHTRFAIVGMEIPLNSEWSLLGEVMRGRTNMGFGPGANVSFDMDASYLLLSRAQTSWTYSVRLESFHLGELDRSIGELNSPNGNGVTFAALNNVGQWRFGLEAKYFDIKRAGNLEFAGDPNQGGYQLNLIARTYF